MIWRLFPGKRRPLNGSKYMEASSLHQFSDKCTLLRHRSSQEHHASTMYQGPPVLGQGEDLELCYFSASSDMARH